MSNMRLSLDELSSAAVVEEIAPLEICGTSEHHDGSHCHNPDCMEDNQTVMGQDFVGEEKHEDSLDVSPVMLPSTSVKPNTQAESSDLVKTLDSPKCDQNTLLALTIAYCLPL